MSNNISLLLHSSQPGCLLYTKRLGPPEHFEHNTTLKLNKYAFFHQMCLKLMYQFKLKFELDINVYKIF
jgi:hypothetical protein